MPDWLTHILFAYVLCVVLGLRFNTFRNRGNIALVMIGSLLPDVAKIELLVNLFDIEAGDFITPLHTPAGSLLSAGMVSLFFYGTVLVFSLMVLGVATHFTLDMLLGHVSGGMLMLFPFSWSGYQLGVIHTGDYSITIIVLVLAGISLLFDVRRRRVSGEF